jgi:hypothetical protein
MEDSQEASQWRSAGLMSVEEGIRLRRPEWDDETVAEEVERIKESAPEGPQQTSIDRTRELINGAVNGNGTDERQDPAAR